MFSTRPVLQYGKRPTGTVLLYMGPYRLTDLERRQLEANHPGINQAFGAWVPSRTSSFQIWKPDVVFISGIANQEADFSDDDFSSSFASLKAQVDKNRDVPSLPGLGRVAVVGRAPCQKDPEGSVNVFRRWWQSAEDMSMVCFYEGAE